MKIKIQKILNNGHILEEKKIENARYVNYTTKKEFKWLDVTYDKDNKYYYNEPFPKEEYYLRIIIEIE